MLSTTINMQRGTYEAISRAAAHLNTTRRAIIIRLLMRIMRDVAVFQGGFTTVSYQPDDPERRWHCFSIRFKPDENEFFVDLRKVCKSSVSFLLAKAVKKYLKELLDEKENNVYKKAYFTNYIIQRMQDENLITWRIYWGIPKNCNTPMLE